MKLNEYLAKNAVKLMIKGSGEKNPTRQTNDLGACTIMLRTLKASSAKWSGFAIIAQMRTRPKSRFVTSNLPRLL